MAGVWAAKRWVGLLGQVSRMAGSSHAAGEIQEPVPAKAKQLAEIILDRVDTLSRVLAVLIRALCARESIADDQRSATGAGVRYKQITINPGQPKNRRSCWF